MEKLYSVWVGGTEVSDSLLTKQEAETLAMLYMVDGYDDVIIERYENGSF